MSYSRPPSPGHGVSPARARRAQRPAPVGGAAPGSSAPASTRSAEKNKINVDKNIHKSVDKNILIINVTRPWSSCRRSSTSSGWPSSWPGTEYFTGKIYKTLKQCHCFPNILYQKLWLVLSVKLEWYLQATENLWILHCIRHPRLLLKWVTNRFLKSNCSTLLVFSLYMVLSYGFNYFWSPEYNIINVTESQNKKVGEKIRLSCQADDFWEWCRRVTSHTNIIIHWDPVTIKQIFPQSSVWLYSFI